MTRNSILKSDLFDRQPMYEINDLKRINELIKWTFWYIFNCTQMLNSLMYTDKYTICLCEIIKCLDKFKGSSIYYLMYSFLTYTIGC